MNILIDVLPETVTVSGNEYNIRTDFRIAMMFEILMQDDSLEPKDKTRKALRLFYEKVPRDLEGAVNAILWFYKCGREENPQKKKMAAKRSKTKVYSFDYDDDYIYAAFMSQYGIDLQDIEYMHWWKFRAMFNSLDSTNQFVKIMEYRSVDINSVPKEQQSFYRKMQRLYALPIRDSEQKKMDKIEAALLNGGDLSGLL